jgi:hypothetical protein
MDSEILARRKAVGNCDAGGKRYLQVNVTKEQLDAQRAFNKDDYGANRNAERLVVGSVAANAVAPVPSTPEAAGGLDMSTLKPIDAASLKSGDLKGIDVIGSDGTKIAEKGRIRVAHVSFLRISASVMRSTPIVEIGCWSLGKNAIAGVPTKT